MLILVATLSPYKWLMLVSNFATITRHVVDIKQINTVFTIQIVSEDKPIHKRNNNEFMRQKMHAYSMYTILNE